MPEKIRWRSKYDSLLIDHERTVAELATANMEVADLKTDVQARDNMIDELKRAVERAKLEGAHALSGALLVDGQ